MAIIKKSIITKRAAQQRACTDLTFAHVTAVMRKQLSASKLISITLILAVLNGCAMQSSSDTAIPDSKTQDGTTAPVKQPNKTSSVEEDNNAKQSNKARATDTAASTDLPIPSQSVYPLLVAEFAIRRQQYQLALATYLDQAQKTRNIDIVKHSAKLANFLKADNATLHAAKLWQDIEPTNHEPRQLSALLLSKTKKPQDALKELQKAEALGAQANYSSVIAENLDLDGEKRAELLLDINEMLSKQPNNTELLLAKALLQQRSGLLTDALTSTQQALTKAPTHINAMTLESKLLLQTNQKSIAFTRFDNTLKQYPDNHEMRFRYARLLAEQDLEKAQEQFRILTKETPENDNIRLFYALILFENKQFDQAEAQFNQLLQFNQRTNQSHFYLGRIADHKQQPQKALNHYKQVRTSPDFVNAIRAQLRILAKEDRYSEAEHVLINARREQPNTGDTFLLLQAELYKHKGNHDKSLALFNTGVVDYPQNLQIRYARAMLLAEKDELVEFEKDLRYILNVNPKHILALNALGYTLADQTTRYDEALALISQALEQAPNQPAILDSMGWVQYKLGNLNAAHDYLLRAYKAMPDHEVAAHYGEVLWALDKKKEAQKIWQSALKNTPKSKPITDALKRLNASLE